MDKKYAGSSSMNFSRGISQRRIRIPAVQSALRRNGTPKTPFDTILSSSSPVAGDDDTETDIVPHHIPIPATKPKTACVGKKEINFPAPSLPTI
mmetsp:Transcript_21669/g.31934  ORF Transcript_21669/g.31934 Transcript_21669/m.31934 type:complete len:94 (-) Transcript_21669:40-321(-)